MQALFNGFMTMGFGVGLLLLGPVSLVENAVYTTFVFFRGERRNTAKALLLGTLIISALSILIYIGLIVLTSEIGLIVLTSERAEFSEPQIPFPVFFGLAVLIPIFWAWYFVFVPQIIIRKVLSKGGPGTAPNRRYTTVIFRIILTVVLPAALYITNGIMGHIFGIPSD